MRIGGASRINGLFPVIIGCALITLTTGCATSKLSPEVRSSLRTVSVNTDVPVTDDMFYYGKEQSMGGMFGIGGSIAGGVAAAKPVDIIKEKMESEGIDLGQMTYETFTKQLSASGLFRQIVPAAADADFDLEVVMIGLARPPGFSMELKPMIEIAASLTRDGDEVLWRTKADISNLSKKTPQHEFKIYMESPDKLRDTFQVAIDHVVAELIENLKKP